MDGEVWVHNTRVRGHLLRERRPRSQGLLRDRRSGPDLPYGPTWCDTSVAYRGVVAFGRIRIVEERAQKQRFFEAFMDKYRDPRWERAPPFISAPRSGDGVRDRDRTDDRQADAAARAGRQWSTGRRSEVRRSRHAGLIAWDAHTDHTSIAHDDDGSGEPALLLLSGWCVDRSVYADRARVQRGAACCARLARSW